MSRFTEFTTASTDHQRRRLAEELQLLPRVATRELKEQWQKLIGSPPPGGLSRDLLMRVIANQLQEATLGGLLPRVKRKLAALAGNAENDPKGSALTPMARLKPGSKLVRTWHGQTHSVLVLDDGFEHQGRRYASLSQIAGAVTGVHWSGPRFFGLDRPQRQPAGSKSCNGSS